ncbi:DEAD/DEAH box helicase [Nafulsella turpanensis]|uniref:DEAD/DEAH box helicase n=1 Tax=Nafulsella turpanensis TaxID=1265690 RepID=UPI000348EEAA|nr:DEAD/DEAH box helicase [Nafulsella turpanensis]
MSNVNFEDLGLSSATMQALQQMGFTQASPIQAQAIPHLLEGKDVIGQAQTGTGKTAAFGIPLAERIDPANKAIQALVLCPTRELAVQVNTELKKILQFHPKLNTLAIYGGESIDKQFKALKRGVQIIVGTPGRVQDHLNRGTIKLDNLQMLVLDEADEMLDMGFREDIESILTHAPQGIQTIFFSATMPKPILELTKKYQQDPVLVKMEMKELTVERIEQIYYEVRRSDKFDLLQVVIELHQLNMMLVFCNTKRMCDELVEKLQAAGLGAEALHGDLSQAQRDRVMAKFRNGTSNILVATDVAARGIDVKGVDAVINYDLPQETEQYVHRIGRTGRAGTTGQAFTFVDKRERGKLKDIERYTKATVNRHELPSSGEILKMKHQKIVEDMRQTLENENLEAYNHILEALYQEGYDYTQIAAAFAQKLLAKNEARIKDLKLEKPSEGRSNGRERNNDRSNGRNNERSGGAARGKGNSNFIPDGDVARLFFNLGKKAKVSPADFLGAITGETGLPGRKVGDIDIYDKFTFVDVPAEDAQKIIQIMSRRKIKGKSVNVELADN